MKKTKSLFLFLSLFALLSVSSCNDNESTGAKSQQIEGTVAYINSYGQVVPDFTPTQMHEAGFDFADLMSVTLADTIVMKNVPFLTSFNEGKMFEPLFVDYNGKGNNYGFGILSSDFHHVIGGHPGDKVKITLESKAGYQKNYELLKSIYPIERREGETAEVYANFRPITTTGMAQGVVYRSSNPINNSNNAGRYCVVDSLARVVGIQTELDLADTPESAAKYIASEGYASTYCPQLLAEGNTICLGLTVEVFGQDFKEAMTRMARFMISHKAPYLVHCNEGKDRCGFVSMLLEALAGANVEELRRDYMVTMLNYYKIADQGESYKFRQEISIDRMIWALCQTDVQSNLLSANWDKVSESVSALTPAALQAAARNYFLEGGLTSSECDELVKILHAEK